MSPGATPSGAALPEVTLRSGGAVVEVNLEATPLTGRVEVSLLGEAGILVSALVA